MAAPAPAPVSLTEVIQQVAASSVNHNSVAQILRTFAPTEVREIVLASLLPGPQDPLALLDIRAHTLLLLFILYVFGALSFSLSLSLSECLGCVVGIDVFLVAGLQIGAVGCCGRRRRRGCTTR